MPRRKNPIPNPKHSKEGSIAYMLWYWSTQDYEDEKFDPEEKKGSFFRGRAKRILAVCKKKDSKGGR